MEEGYIYLEKSSCLGLEKESSCHFLPLLILQIRKYSSMFGFLWRSPSLNSQMAYKKMSALIWLWVYNDDFGLQSRSTPQGLFRYLGCATHFLFDARALWDT